MQDILDRFRKSPYLRKKVAQELKMEAEDVEAVIEQYRGAEKKIRMAHLAVDDQRVKFCAHLKGKASWFLPFDQGWNDGAGNPPNPDGLATDYLWRRILEPRSLANIIESYAQIVTVKNPKTGKMTSTQIFPRYHQLDVVRRLLADVEANGVAIGSPNAAATSGSPSMRRVITFQLLMPEWRDAPV